MNIVKEQLEKITFSTEKPKNFNIINENVNTILKPKKNKKISIAGATSGIGLKLLKLLKEKGIEVTPIGSRNSEKLKEIASSANKNGEFINGNLFEKGSKAYKYYTKELAERKEGGVEHIMSSINMDREYVIVDKKGEIVEGDISEYINEKLSIKEEYKNKYFIDKDYYDPRTGNKEKWSDNIKEEKRKEIRKEMADEQIKFWEEMLKSLSEGNKKDTPLIINFANSIGSKFYENHSVKKAGSEYGRLKKEITEMIRKYFDVLVEKNIYIKNIIIPVVASEMWTNRSDLNSKLTGKIVDGIGFTIPLDGEPILPNKALKSQDVANFLYEIGNSNPLELPSVIPIIDVNYLDIKNQKKQYQKDKINIINKIKASKIETKDDRVIITNDVKTFLINLRKTALNEYIINDKIRIEIEIELKFKKIDSTKNNDIDNEKKKIEKQKNLKLKMLEKITNDNHSNIVEGNKIIDGLEEEISYEKFIEICLILEKNYS